MEGEVVTTFAEEIATYGEAFVDLITKFLGLFKVYPLNVLFIAGLGFVTIGYFAKLKRSAR